MGVGIGTSQKICFFGMIVGFWKSLWLLGIKMQRWLIIWTCTMGALIEILLFLYWLWARIFGLILEGLVSAKILSPVCRMIDDLDSFQMSRLQSEYLLQSSKKWVGKTNTILGVQCEGLKLLLMLASLLSPQWKGRYYQLTIWGKWVLLFRIGGVCASLIGRL